MIRNEEGVRTVIVVGHKNPDTDSICSAIAYAQLKKEKKVPCEPYRAGPLNEESRFVLERFGVPEPQLCTDVSAQVRDIEIRRIAGVDGMLSLKQAWILMRDLNIDTLPVVSEKGRLDGLIAVKDIATANMDIFDNRILASSHTPYTNILDTLDGSMLVGDESGAVTRGKVIIGAANPDVMETFIEEGDLVLLGNRYESQLCAIEMNAGCIIACMDTPVSGTIQKLAREKNCAVITTPHDSYIAARLINQSPPVHYFMKREGLLAFQIDALVEDMKSVMAKVRHRYFPVLDESGLYLGMISRRNLLNMKRKQVILVDHNEKSQAVDGLEEAEILEIIDHHRLGSLETIAPVYFRNQPLGCTSTIIRQMYQESGVAIPPQTAGLLCAAILSDTLMFRSPTCTPMDEAAANELAALAGIDIAAFAEEMFEAGSSLKDKTAAEIVYQDFKTFTSAGVRFGVGQSNFMSGSVVKAAEKLARPFMEEVLQKHRLEMLFYMLTNIPEQSTELLFFGAGAGEAAQAAFDQPIREGRILLPGVVSRKKQLIPALMTALQHL